MVHYTSRFSTALSSKNASYFQLKPLLPRLTGTERYNQQWLQNFSSSAALEKGVDYRVSFKTKASSCKCDISAGTMQA
jgi:hypothetical protein